jgi:putative FmdB family regulatory protein
MPSYQFYCKACDDVVDTFFAITEKHQDVVCETCGHKRIKQFGVGAVTFKGQGWGHQ